MTVFKKKENRQVIPPYQILLISDNRSSVQLMKRYFSSKQFKILDFTSCSQAWKELQDQNPKLILLDMALPEKNRNLLMKRVELDKKLKKVPIKMFTKKEFEKSIFPNKKAYHPYKEDIVDFFKF